MAERLIGSLEAGSRRFAVVVSRFNEVVTARLVEGATAALRRGGAGPDAITVVEVPGAWELPVAARRLAECGVFSAVIALGCVIRGQTPHFDFVAGEAARGLSEIALRTGIPITLGVLTTDNLEQALERAGGKVGNKGADAAEAALEMASLLARLAGIR